MTQQMGPLLRRYSYDEAGNLAGFSENEFARTLGYDLRDRMISSEQSNGPTQTFAYDANGNRTSVSTGGTPITYAYAPGSNRLAQVGMTARTYDGAGNTVTDGARTYLHSPAGDLKEVRSGTATLGTYAYDADHRRVRAEVPANGSEEFYVYDEESLRIATEAYDPGSTHRDGYTLIGRLIETDTLYADGEPIAQIRPNPSNGIETLLYLHPDHLGAPRTATSATGTVVWRWRGSVFGEGGIDDDPDADGTHITINLRHPGQWFDAETGLFDNWHRSYEPGTGRYVQADPIGIAGGMNSYSYVGNGPLNAVDLLGLYAMIICHRCGTNGAMECKYFEWDESRPTGAPDYVSDEFPTNTGANSSPLPGTGAGGSNDPYGTNGPIPPGRYGLTNSLSRKFGRDLPSPSNTGVPGRILTPLGTVRTGIRVHSGSYSEGCITCGPLRQERDIRDLVNRNSSRGGTDVQIYEKSCCNGD